MAYIYEFRGLLAHDSSIAFDSVSLSSSASQSSTSAGSSAMTCGFFSVWSTPTFHFQLNDVYTCTSKSYPAVISKNAETSCSLSTNSGPSSSFTMTITRISTSKEPLSPSTSFIKSIETDCLPLVFSCLDFQDLTRASAVCKTMKEAVSSTSTDEEIWSSLWHEALDVIGKNDHGEPDLMVCFL
eukprot:TRINITY_DN3579_c0_g1_i5.p1 TRINITY_DN3579_c0_g1~~TRINITY_DN3579_c0_g1_i5.p1  ORF type:complete len:184 (-),score=4.49 TRINITY_DN3579_c0_g1_i5:167-718(-)